MATSDIDVLTRLVDVAGADVADVGCGQGGFTVALAQRGARATGIEVTPDRVDVARRASDGSAATFALGRGEALGLPDGSQDVVVYVRSLHHVPVAAMDAALREARRVLRADGVLAVIEPLPEGDFFALVALVDDETEVRAAAQRALARAGEHGFARAHEERFELTTRIGGLDELRARIVGVDPARGPVFDARRDELARRLATGGRAITNSIREFRTPEQIIVLRAS